MHRIDTSTKAVDLFGAGKHGFKNGDKALGISATDLDAAMFNAVQEEVVGVIEAAGIALIKGNHTQLLSALQAMLAPLAIQAGSILYVPATAAPTGYLKANGALVSRITYAGLWAYAQASGNLAATDGAWAAGKFSPGDGATTFRIPDLRGEFIRGWDDARGVDSGRAIGTAQADELKSHTHTGGFSSQTQAGSGGTYWAGLVSANTGSTGGTETRPRNIALLGCIKY